MSKISELFDMITEEISKENYLGMLDDAELEFVDYEQMKEEGFEDEHEYYQAYCTDEAQIQVIEHTLIQIAKNKTGYELSIDESCDLYDKLKEHYEN